MTPPPQPDGWPPTVADVFVTVVRLEGKVDAIATSVTGMERILADHETRLRRLEASRWPARSIRLLTEVAAVVVASAAVIVPTIITLH